VGGATALDVGGLTVVVGGACVVVVGGCVAVVVGGCVVVVVGGCVVVVVGAVVVVVLESVVVVVVLESVVVAVVLLSLDGAVDDGGGVTTVGLPLLPVIVTVWVRGAPGVWGFVTAGDVTVLVPVRIGLDLLVSVHTSPVPNTSTANNAAANKT
jgi:hypothetical protein